MPKITVRNKKICVAGLQGPGIALIEALHQGGAKVTGAQVMDLAEQRHLFSKISKEKAHWVFSEDLQQELLDQDLIIITVGHLTLRKALDKARAKGIPVIGEVDFVSQFFRGTVVGITGTNGKTTTAHLLKCLLDEAGLSSANVAGEDNPLALALGQNLQVVICELNSVRLKESKSFHPHIAILTNLSAAHTERHRNFLDYFLTKAKIYEHQGPSDFLVFNHLSEPIKSIFERKPPLGRRVPFDYTGENKEGMYREGKELVWNFQEAASRFSTAKFSLPGAHNIENLMAAVSAAKLLGVEDAAIQKAIPKMTPLPIRLQPLGLVEGVKYISDARSTNPVATAWALHALKKDVLLIAGGQFMRGMDYGPLKDYLKRFAKLVVLFGTDRRKFFEAWVGATEIFTVETLQDAVRLANQKAVKGDTVVFSPASPPELHVHGTVKVRGREFEKFFLELKGHEKQRKTLRHEFQKL